jgi:hypothetical protein
MVLAFGLAGPCLGKESQIRMKIRVSAPCSLLLMVNLYDAKAKQLVWRGVAQGTLSNNGDKNQNLVHKAVEKMFKKYPKT